MAAVGSCVSGSLVAARVRGLCTVLVTLKGEWEDRRGQNPAKSVFPSVCGVKRWGEIRRGCQSDGQLLPDISGGAPDFSPASGPKAPVASCILSVVTPSISLAEGPLRGECSEVGQRDAGHAWFVWTLSGREKRSAWQMWPHLLPTSRLAHRQPPSASPSRVFFPSRQRHCATSASQMESGVPMRSRVRRPRRSSPDR